MQSKQWLTRGDGIPILDKPLDDDATVGRAHRHFVRRFLTIPTVLWVGRIVSASMSSVRTNWPLPGETIRRQVGLPAIGGGGCCTAVLLNELHRLFQLIRSVESEELHALEVPLRDAGQGACRRHLQQAGDAEIAHGCHAKVPADRRGHLAHQPAEYLAAIVHDLAIGI